MNTKFIKTAGFAALIILGALMFVYAGVDDSPGGQLLGLLVGLFGIVKIYKLFRSRRG